MRSGESLTPSSSRFHYSPSDQPLSPAEALALAANCTFSPGNGGRVERRQVGRSAAALSGVPCDRRRNINLAEAVVLVREVPAR